jgi:hypothetical protein
MLGFPRLDDSVIDRLGFGKTACSLDEALAGLCQRQNAQRFSSGYGERSFRHKARLPEPPDIPFHARVVGCIGKASEVGRGGDAKLAQFAQRMEFGLAEQKCAVAESISAR